MNCQYCGKEESLPFVCNYCGGVFCGEHRLPESHRCTGDLSRRPVAETTASTFSWSDAAVSAGRRPISMSFTRHEVRDIIIAWLALGTAFTIAETGGLIQGFAYVIGVCNPVALTCAPNSPHTVIPTALVLVMALGTVGAGFVLHELMHKFTSQRYGFQAEFRMWPQGLVLALVISTFTGFVFAAPGATYIEGYGIRTKENGIISFAGPLTNVIIAVLFVPLYVVGLDLNNPYLFLAGFLGSYFNVFLGAFNMLPVMPLDGAKVLRWNKVLWAVVFVPLAVLLLLYFTGYLAAI